MTDGRCASGTPRTKRYGWAMGGEGSGERLVADGKPLGDAAMMHVGGREQAEARVPACLRHRPNGVEPQDAGLTAAPHDSRTFSYHERAGCSSA
jgi:hypothetical protein